MNLPKEEILRHLWNKKYLQTKNLKTINGKDLNIINFGVLQRGSGPDFLNAKIKISNKILIGDIEFHRTIEDWGFHNHEKDKNYNNVILHVVFENPKVLKFVKSESENIIPTISISEFLIGRLENLLETIQKEEFASANKIIKCYLQNEEIPAEIINEAIEYYSMERFSDKVKKLKNGVKEFKGEKIWEKVFYENIFDVLGFSQNRIAMKNLVKHIDLDDFYKLKQIKNISLSEIQSLLFYFSGFLNNISNNEIFSKIKKHEMLTEAKDILKLSKENKMSFSFLKKEINPIEWKNSNLRPSNSPQIRVIAGAIYVYKIIYNNLFDQIVNIFKDPILDLKTKLKRIIDLLKIEEEEFWEEHFTLNNKTKITHKIIGSNRILDIIMNVICPLMLFYGSENKDNVIIENANKISRIIPKMETNAVLEKMKKQLLKNKYKIKYGFEQQAILQIYNNYCFKNNCKNCLIGKKIKWQIG